MKLYGGGRAPYKCGGGAPGDQLSSTSGAGALGAEALELSVNKPPRVSYPEFKSFLLPTLTLKNQR